MWPRTPRTNRAVIAGLLHGYREAGLRVGFYSTPYVWEQILGGARYGLPEWRSAGETSLDAARQRCAGGAFQGGPALLAQWWVPRKDFDIACPARAAAVLGAWFHRW